MENKFKHIIITGHFGSGKTNIAVNLAVNTAKISTKKVFLIDADVVNPYFRSADNAEYLCQNGVSLIAPIYANTGVDLPAMPPDVNKVFASDCVAFWDIGGDETGAKVLGRYSDEIAKQGYEMLYIVNFYRPLTEEENSLATLMYEIEASSRLKMTSIVNNSNLSTETTAETVRQTNEKIKTLSKTLNLPIKMTCIKKDIKITADSPKTTDFYPLEMVTRSLF